MRRQQRNTDLRASHFRSSEPEPVAPLARGRHYTRAGLRTDALTRIRTWAMPSLLAVAICAFYQAGEQLVHLGIFQAVMIAVVGLAASIIALVLTRGRRLEGDRGGLAGAVEQASDAIVITDAGGHIQYVNPAFSRLTGYSAQEVIGQNPRLLQSLRQDRAFYKDLWDTIRDGRVWHGAPVNRRKDGTLYVEEMTIAPVRDSTGKISRFIAIKQDATARREALEAQGFLASIVESSSDAIISATVDGRIMSWNGGAEALYGYRAEEVLGQPMFMLVSSEYCDHMQRWSELIVRGENVPHLDGVAKRKDGKRVDISVQPCPVKNAAGQIVGQAAILRDMSLRKEAEQARGLLAAIVESSSVGIFSCAPDGRFLTWNIALLLLKWLHYLSKSAWSLSNLASMLRLNLFTNRELSQWLDNPMGTPPLIPAAEQLTLPLV